MAGIRNNLPIVLIVMITPIIEMCLNENSTTVAIDCLINNWKMYYYSADVIQDGILSIEDAQECMKSLVEKELLNAEGKKSFEKYWDECLFRGIKGNISEHDFVDSLKTDFNADNEKFKKEVDICYYTAFYDVDLNRDQYISKDELQTIMGAFSYQDIPKDNGYFAAHNPNNDGLFPYCDIVVFWVGFLKIQ